MTKDSLKIYSWGLQKQMVMIRHKTELSFISPGGDVVENIRIFDPQRSSHRRGISPRRSSQECRLTPIPTVGGCFWKGIKEVG
jgi:hypothetical protein